MNTKQETTIERLKKAILQKNSYGERQAEIKNCQVSETDFFVSLVIEVGAPNDEQTMASVFCRESRQIFIGKRGGVSLASVSSGTSFKSFGFKQINEFWNVVHTLPF